MDSKIDTDIKEQLEDLTDIQFVAGTLRKNMACFFDKYNGKNKESNKMLIELSNSVCELLADISIYWGELIADQCK